MPAALIAHSPGIHRPRPSLLAVALALDVACGALLAVQFLLVGSGQRGGDTFFADPALAAAGFGAAAAALAGGGVAVAAAIREPPVTRAGRIAVGAPFASLPLFAAGGLAVLLGADPEPAYLPAQAAWFVLTFAGIVGGIATWLEGDRRALLAVPLAVGLFVALLLVGELAARA